MPLWRGGPNTRTLPTVLLTPSANKAADMAHLCVPQNQALGVCRGFAPDIQICGTHGRKNLVNATIISNAEEEEDNNLSWTPHANTMSKKKKFTKEFQLSNITFSSYLTTGLIYGIQEMRTALNLPKPFPNPFQRLAQINSPETVIS